MATYGQSEIGPFKIFKIINEENTSSGFLCSILEANNSTIFIKLNIPLNGVYELENDFKIFCSTFKYLENQK